MTKTLDLPPVLAAYFAAQNAHDINGLLACFAEDARVRDEGEDIVGHAAIRRWKEKASAKYKIQAQPLRSTDSDGQVTVVALVSGTFPGSPAELTFRFGLDHGSIASLEVN
jgi:ketosteroid isomerase-like protein